MWMQFSGEKSWKHWHDWCSDAKSALKEIEIETKPFAILLIQTFNKNNFICNFPHHWNMKQTFWNASKRSNKLIWASNKEVFKIFCDHPRNFNIRTEYNRKLLMPNNYVFFLFQTNSFDLNLLRTFSNHYTMFRRTLPLLTLCSCKLPPSWPSLLDKQANNNTFKRKSAFANKWLKHKLVFFAQGISSIVLLGEEPKAKIFKNTCLNIIC